MFKQPNTAIHISTFREQLRRDVSEYIKKRSQHQFTYLAVKEFMLHSHSSAINQPIDTRSDIKRFFEGNEYTVLYGLIDAIESMELSHHLRDRIFLIYQDLPKRLSFFYPLVLLADKLKITLAKYPREKLLEAEIEIKHLCVLSCHEEIQNLTEKCQQSLESYEALTKKANVLACVDNIEKGELAEQLKTAHDQCETYRQKAIDQQQQLNALSDSNRLLQQENSELKQQIESIVKINDELQQQTKKLQASYEKICQQYESSPIKNQKELEAWEERIILNSAVDTLQAKKMSLLLI